MSLKMRILIAVSALAIAVGSIMLYNVMHPAKEIDQSHFLYPAYIVVDDQIRVVYQ